MSVAVRQPRSMVSGGRSIGTHASINSKKEEELEINASESQFQARNRFKLPRNLINVYTSMINL